MSAAAKTLSFEEMDKLHGYAPGYSEKAHRREEAAKCLGAYQIDHYAPFAGGDHSTVSEILLELHGLTTVLASAHMDADDIERRSSGDSMMNGSYPIFMGRAWEAAGRLAALASFFHDAACAERRPS